jgi:hypothetical protein
MTCKEWTILIIGAITGASIVLVFTLIFGWIQKRLKYAKLKSNLKPYFGKYSVRSKSGESPHLQSVFLSYNKQNILNIKFKTLNNGPAIGSVIVDEVTLKYGQAFYHHTEKEFEDKSGFYEIQFIQDGIIHAKLSYIKGDNRAEIIEQYIWEKDS